MRFFKGIVISMLILSGKQFAQNLDSSAYFNKSIPKNSLTASIFGESGYYGAGYERAISSHKNYRLCLSTKIGSAARDGFTLPLGITQELFEGKNKLFHSIYLGNHIAPLSKRYSLSDVKELEANPNPLKHPVVFFYTPYAAMSLGYKRYFSPKHAISIYATGGIVPQFELISTTEAKLIGRLIGFGGFTYYYQF